MCSYYPLEDVHSVVLDAQRGGHIPTFNDAKSTAVVSDRLDVTLSQAKAFIYEQLLQLCIDDFHRTSPTPPPPADIYAIEARQIGWYVKFKLEDDPVPRDRLNVCAFHPPEKPTRVKSGHSIK